MGEEQIANTETFNWKIQDVKEIFETCYETEVNAYLKNGWVLIDVYKTCYDPVYFKDHQTMHYVLGWVKSEEPWHPKPFSFTD